MPNGCFGAIKKSSVCSALKLRPPSSCTSRTKCLPLQNKAFTKCTRRSFASLAGAPCLILSKCQAASVVPVPELAAGSLSVHAVCHIAATCIILAATVRNVPQLLRCWRERSANGISIASLGTEISCYAAMVAYGMRKGYAMTIWGSDMACWLQDSILIGLVAFLKGVCLPRAGAFVALWLALQALLFTPAVPMWALAKFQIFAGLILGLGARLPQIILNFRNGCTGTLAPQTFIFNATSNLVNGTAAALLTGDMYVIGTQIWMFILNVTVVCQIFGYAAKERARVAEEVKVPRGRWTYPLEREGYPYNGIRPGYA